jgi:hypothetical protein
MMFGVCSRHSAWHGFGATGRAGGLYNGQLRSVAFSYRLAVRVTRTGRGGSRLAPSLWEVREEVAIAVTIGASVALIVIGAILRFGVTWQPAHVDLQVIGVILMVAGALGLALSLLFMVIRRNDRRSAQVYEERRYNEPPM